MKRIAGINLKCKRRVTLRHLRTEWRFRIHINFVDGINDSRFFYLMFAIVIVVAVGRYILRKSFPIQR